MSRRRRARAQSVGSSAITSAFRPYRIVFEQRGELDPVGERHRNQGGQRGIDRATFDSREMLRVNADLLGCLLLREPLSVTNRANPPAEPAALPDDGLLQRSPAPNLGAAMRMWRGGAGHPNRLREGTLKLNNLEVTLEPRELWNRRIR